MSKTILLGEDEEADVYLTLLALSENNAAVETVVARDGQEVLDYLSGQGNHDGRDPADQPALVMLDLNLPRKDGREVLEELKNDPELRTIPVVVLTTSNSDQDILHAYKLHANCYITKPIEFARFIDVVKSIKQFWLTVVTLPEKV